jgi:signal transduction histidine kinase
LNCIETFQQLYRQFPSQNKQFLRFAGVEKFLKKKLGVNRVALIQRKKEMFKPGAEHENAFTPLPVSSVCFIEKNKKPWFSAGKRNGLWSGLWPIWVEGELAACFAVGWKNGGKTLEAEEKILVELTAERIGYFFREHYFWKHLGSSNRLASIGLMSAALMHEIRNPLTALSTLAQLLPSKRNDERFMETFEKLMLQAILRLTTLTESFLGFSKADLEKKGCVDIALTIATVAQLFGPLFTNKKIKLKVQTKPNLFVKGDSAHIESLVLNLLQNAFQSVGSKGTIEISACLLRRNPGGPGAWIRFQVKDNGCGISKKDLQRLFIPFFSTKCDGTGLGLMICKKIVQNHGGILKASGNIGKGAIFSVFLPAFIKKQ